MIGTDRVVSAVCVSRVFGVSTTIFQNHHSSIQDTVII